MNENGTESERRVESRSLPTQYHSVQFTKQGLNITYQFKIRNISTKGMCILVREDSHVMNHLNLFGTGYYSQAISIIKKYVK